MFTIYRCDECSKRTGAPAYHCTVGWGHVFTFFWAQVVIAALLQVAWEEGVWGHTPWWLEELFHEAAL